MRTALMKLLPAALVLTPVAQSVVLGGESADVVGSLEAKRSHYYEVGRRIWEIAEVGYQEAKSSALLKEELTKAGFRIESGVAEIPTAFIASHGEGKPVVAILAEFDALPGMSQDAVPERRPLTENGPGHGCGHHLFGTASTAAAIAVKEWMEATKTPGTIRLYGTPAEEGGAGKVYLVRAGLFNDVDAVFGWHPGDGNDASPGTSLANVSAKFRFHGVSAHAAGAPEQARSALDGVEAMDYMVNLMREHVPSDARIHYVITHGGMAPNVVPDFAEVYYYCRHHEIATVKEMFVRIVKASQGAAMGTSTEVDHEIIHGIYSLLPNHYLGKLLHASLEKVGGVAYTPEEQAFAERIQKSLPKPEPLGSQEKVEPWGTRTGGGSTDVGDISWVVPTAQFRAATWVPGTPSHSWQAVACGGMSIGFKGMMVAAKTLALTAVEVYQNPGHVEKARQELLAARGPNFKYEPLVGDRKPPLDYRK